MKVTIAGGAGGVGASTAFNLMLMRGGHEIALVDSRPEMITSHVMDLDQVAELSPGCVVRGGDEADVRDADVLVLISATPLTVGASRLDYLGKNARIADAFADLLQEAWPGVLLVVTNPVDPIVTTAATTRPASTGAGCSGYTINDSLRLRTGLARALGVEPGRVEALGDRRARRPQRAALRPCHGRRRARASDRRAGSRGRGVPAHVVRPSCRPRLGALLDVDVGPCSRSNGDARSAARGGSSGRHRSCWRASTASTALR